MSKKFYPDAEELSLSLLEKKMFAPIDLEKLKIWPPDLTQRRQAPRYHLRFEVYLSNDQQIFRTTSENISFTGLLLKELVPEPFVTRGFDVVIKGPDNEYFFFRGVMIWDGKFRSRRIQFSAMTPDTEIKLIDLLENITAIC